tara:strand:+ start:48 stop:458 length:411 start_codon:yes stop_codon:yes gene_type:complete
MSIPFNAHATVAAAVTVKLVDAPVAAAKLDPPTWASTLAKVLGVPLWSIDDTLCAMIKWYPAFNDEMNDMCASYQATGACVRLVEVDWEDKKQIVRYLHEYARHVTPNERVALLLGSDVALRAMGLETMAEEALSS